MSPLPEENSRVRELKQKSVLNSVRYFDVYRRGKKVGSYTVRDAVLVGPFGQVVGIRTGRGFTPGYDDIAIANAPVQPDFWLSRSSLSLTQTRQLDSMVANLFPKTLPGNRVAPAASGKPLRFKTIWETSIFWTWSEMGILGFSSRERPR